MLMKPFAAATWSASPSPPCTSTTQSLLYNGRRSPSLYSFIAALTCDMRSCGFAATVSRVKLESTATGSMVQKADSNIAKRGSKDAIFSCSSRPMLLHGSRLIEERWRDDALSSRQRACVFNVHLRVRIHVVVAIDKLEVSAMVYKSRLLSYFLPTAVMHLYIGILYNIYIYTGRSDHMMTEGISLCDRRCHAW